MTFWADNMDKNHSSIILDALESYSFNVIATISRSSDEGIKEDLDGLLKQIGIAIDHVTEWSDTINGLSE